MNAPDGAFSWVDAGLRHRCGVQASGGAVACWGYNTHGESDAPDGAFSVVSADGRHSCGLLQESGEIVCWGYTFDGQQQPPSGRHTALSAGGDHVCALSESGSVSCWMVFNAAADVPARLRADVGEEPSSGSASDDSTETSQTDAPDDSTETPEDSGSQSVAPPPAVSVDAGRIVARRLANGSAEFGWLPEGGSDYVLPRGRYFPTDATVGRWLRSTPIEVNDVVIGRINARLGADGRIEFGFTPTGGERILPRLRRLPVGATVDRWLRSNVIELDGG